MKKVMLIDGYNVVRRTGAFDRALDRSLEAARDAFIERIKIYCLKKRAFDEIIVVFDGSAKVSFESQRYKNGPVNVIFSASGESADDFITTFLRNKLASSRITVVSDDNYVTNSARAFGADVMPCGDFMELTRSQRQPQEAPADEKTLDTKAAAAINEQLRKKWRIN